MTMETAAGTEAATTETPAGTETPPAGEAPPAETPHGGEPESEGAGGDGQSGEGEAEGGEGDGKPVEYADFIMPEGVEYDPEIGGELKSLAAELKLTPDQAQKFADLGGKMAQAQHAKYAAVVAAWGEQAKSDKEFGGDKLNENLAIAKAAAQKMGGDALLQVLESSGLGNHPDMIRAFWKMGQAMADDKPVFGNGGGGGTLDARSLYPNSNMNK